MGALELDECIVAFRIQSHMLNGYMYAGKKMSCIVMSLIRGRYAGARVVTVPDEPRYLRAPDSTYNSPAAVGFVEGVVAAFAIEMMLPVLPPKSELEMPRLPARVPPAELKKRCILVSQEDPNVLFAWTVLS